MFKNENGNKILGEINQAPLIDYSHMKEGASKVDRRLDGLEEYKWNKNIRRKGKNKEYDSYPKRHHDDPAGGCL